MYKLLLVISAFLLFSCDTTVSDEGQQNQMENIAQNNSQFGKKRSVVITKDGITLTEMTDYPMFVDASLSLVSPKDKATPGKTNFEFSVSNFMLGEETAEADKLGLQTDADGQHITFFNSGRLPKTSKKDQIEDNLSVGENYIFATLTRSYGMSVHDSKSAYILKKISIEDHKSTITTPKGSHLIPMSPIGTYLEPYNKKILLDFFLIDVKLQEGGNYVLVTIDNTDFKITKWSSFIIEGLNTGMHSVSFKLMDAKNQLIPGPFNDAGKIEFTLKEKELVL